MVGLQSLVLDMVVRIPHPHPFLRRCFYQKGLKKYLCRFVIFVAACSFMLCLLPSVASADVPSDPINYMDLDYTVKEGASYNQVTVPIPDEYLYLGIYNQSTGLSSVALSGVSSISYTVDPDISYTLRVYPFSTCGLLLENIPEGTRLNFTLRVVVTGSENFYTPSMYKDYQYKNASGNYIGNLVMSQIDGTVYEEVYASYELNSIPDSAYSFVPRFRYVNFGTAYTGSTTYTFIVDDVSLVMDISNGYWEEWLVEQNGQMIDDLGDRIEQSNDALGDRIEQSNTENMEAIRDSMVGVGDQISTEISSATNEIMNGGAEGEELDQKDDILADSAGSVNDGIGQIEDFQSGYMNTAAMELKNLSSSVNINLLATPLKFVQKYSNKVVAGIPSAYLLVFTLPMMFGLAMYILGHPVRAPRPDTSGDEVIRETKTEILEGNNAGRVTVTRTTSREIGRVHRDA